VIDFRSLQIEHFCEQLAHHHQRIFGDSEVELLQNTLNISRMALAKMSISNSLFLNVNHTKRAGIIALEILDGVLHNTGFVDPRLFFNLVMATLISHVGIVGGILEEDEVNPNQPTERYYVGKGKYQTFDAPSSGSVLWPYYKERSLLFVDKNFRSLKNFNAEDVKLAIRASDIAAKETSKDKTDLCRLVRASHILAYMTQSQYNQWLVRLYRSLEEAGLIENLKFNDLGEFRTNYKSYFWDNFLPDLTYAIKLLNGTGTGKGLVAVVYSRMSV
tara:strand:+ start:358 stop:1179 length:822 start_codon:yes stop_codon:yes gene_type:complete